MRFISILSIEKIAKKQKLRMNKDAVEALRDFMEDYGIDIAEKSVELAKHCERRSVLKKDVKFIIGEIHGKRNKKV